MSDDTSGTLRLRGPRGALEVAVHWPGRRPAPLLVVFGLAPDAAAALSPATGCVVLAVGSSAEDDVRTALEWCGEHAGELAARLPVRVGAADAATAPVRRVIAELAGAGWPPIEICDVSMSKTAHPVRPTSDSPNPKELR